MTVEALAEVSDRCRALTAAAAGHDPQALDAAARALADAIATLPKDRAAWAATGLIDQVRAALAIADEARVAIAFHADRSRRRLDALVSRVGTTRPTAYTRAGRYA